MWMGQTDLVIVPSLKEIFGLVALEAMSAGIPVVAHNVDHLPALIGAGEATGVCSLGSTVVWRVCGKQPAPYSQTR